MEVLFLFLFLFLFFFLLIVNCFVIGDLFSFDNMSSLNSKNHFFLLSFKNSFFSVRVTARVFIPCASHLIIDFDTRTNTEQNRDFLMFSRFSLFLFSPLSFFFFSQSVSFSLLLTFLFSLFISLFFFFDAEIRLEEMNLALLVVILEVGELELKGIVLFGLSCLMLLLLIRFFFVYICLFVCCCVFLFFSFFLS